MPVFQLRKDEISFPDPKLGEADGLLAFGGDLSVERLLLAYTNGNIVVVSQRAIFDFPGGSPYFPLHGKISSEA